MSKRTQREKVTDKQEPIIKIYNISLYYIYISLMYSSKKYGCAGMHVRSVEDECAKYDCSRCRKIIH